MISYVKLVNEHGEFLADITPEGYLSNVATNKDGKVLSKWLKKGIPALFGKLSNTETKFYKIIQPDAPMFGMALMQVIEGNDWKVLPDDAKLSNAEEGKGKPCGDSFISPGDTCHIGEGNQTPPSEEKPATGDSGAKSGQIHPELPKNPYVDVTSWPAHNMAAQWSAKKMAFIHSLHQQGKLDELKAMDTKPKSLKPNKYSKAVHEMHQKVLATNFVPQKPEVPKGKADESVGWEKIGPQLGSNPGGKYKGPDGKEYYVKFSKSDDHAKNEVLASSLYQLAGSPVLPVQFHVTDSNKLATRTEWKDAKPINQNNEADRMDTWDNFATHAWLANWDAAGLGYDNQARVGNKMTTLDVGGALKYRAQGAPKDFGKDPVEWDTLRDQTKNPQSAHLFKGITDAQLKASAQKVADIPNHKIIDAVAQVYGHTKQTDNLAEILIDRKNIIAQKAGVPTLEGKTLEQMAAAMTGEPKKLTAPSFDYPLSISKQLIAYDAVAKGYPLPKTGSMQGDDVQKYYQKLKDENANGHKGMDVVNPNQPALPDSPSVIAKGLQFAFKYGQYGLINHLATKSSMPETKAYLGKIQAKVAEIKAAEAFGTKPPPVPEAPKADTTYHMDLGPKKEADLEDAIAITKAAAEAADKKAAETKSIPLPPQTKTTTNPGAQKKFNEIYNASLTGDASKVEAVHTNATTKNTYGKMAHEYKTKVLEAMKGGAKAVGLTAITPVAPVVKPKIKITEKDLPKDPEFISSNASNVEANKLAVEKYKQKALEGDLAYFEALPPHPSAKLTTFKDEITAMLKDKLFPPEPPKAYEGGFKELHQQALVQKVKEAKEKLGYYLVVGNPGVIQHEYGQGKTLPSYGNWTKPHSDAFLALSSTAQSYIKSYTGAAYASMNPAFWSGALSTKEKTAGIGLMKSAQKLEEGTKLYRNISLNPGQLSEMSKSIGKVLQEPAIMSTSTDGSFGSGRNCSIHMIAGPGVRALYIDPHSNCKGEHEMLFPPNTRLLIQKVTKVGAKHIVDAIVLPTVDGQCC